MTLDARKAMEGWMGALARGGVVDADVDDTVDPVASYVVGHDRVVELEQWLRAQPEEIRLRERRAAIEVCIWMANADRKLDPEEVDMLRGLIGSSGLSDDVQDELVSATHDPPSLADIESRLTHPILRELMLALLWEMASVDGNVDRTESALFTGMAKRLEISPERAAEIQAAVAARVG